MRFFRQASILVPYVFVLLTILPIFGAASANTINQSDNVPAPLTETEQWAVLNGALQAGAATGATTLAEATALRYEVLLIEVHQSSNSSDSSNRAGDVYIYSYTTDTLTVTTVDIASGLVVNMLSSQGVQIPLTPAETNRAALIALGNTEILAQTESAYRMQTGSTFTLLEQLSIEAAIFSANEYPNIVNMQSAECGIHRCALLTLRTSAGANLNVQPVVDLSTQLVVQNITDPNAIVSPPGNLGFSDTGLIVDETTSSELPGEVTAPAAASEPLDLGITNPGMIIDENAVAQPTTTNESSQAPSQQPDPNDLGVVNTGTIMGDVVPALAGIEGNEVAQPDPNDLGVVNTGTIVDDAATGLTGLESEIQSQQDANDLGFVSTGLILNETTDLSEGQTSTLGAAKASIFIPVVARRLIKEQMFGQQLTTQQLLFLDWWCIAVSTSPLATEIDDICQ